MGHVNDAAYFVAPAYAATFVVFWVLGIVAFRRLNLWSRRARDADEEIRARDRQPTE
jgi:hypothetical protein